MIARLWLFFAAFSNRCFSLNPAQNAFASRSTLQKMYPIACKKSSSRLAAIAEPGDEALSQAMQMLGEGNVSKAQELLEEATSCYSQAGLTNDRKDLVKEVAKRIGKRLFFDAPSVDGAIGQVEDKIQEASIAGDAFVMKATDYFRQKDYTKAMEAINDARSAFASAGDYGKLARDREPVVGNLYSVILAEIERGGRVEKLLKLKRLNDLVKLKKQADDWGIDWEEFSKVAGIDASSDGPETR